MNFTLDYENFQIIDNDTHKIYKFDDPRTIIIQRNNKRTTLNRIVYAIHHKVPLDLVPTITKSNNPYKIEKLKKARIYYEKARKKYLVLTYINDKRTLVKRCDTLNQAQEVLNEISRTLA